MRLILVNPHSHNFGKMVSGELLRRKSFLKYDYFVDYYLAQKRPLGFYIDGTRNSFGIAKPILPKLFCYLELLCWMLVNKINPFKVKVFFSTKKLNPKTDVLFDFSRSLVDISDEAVRNAPWSHFKGVTLIHFTHYFKDIKKLSKRLTIVPNYIIVTENNLVRSSYFQKFFPQVSQVYHLPFTFADRFTVQQAYEKRLNKCLAIGSITRVANKEFTDFFGDVDRLHPMRNSIYNKAGTYKDEMDSYIQGFNKTTNVRIINPKDTILAKLAKKFLPFFLLEKFYPTPQITYFRFNIVDKFNGYKMFICPEEIVGLPSINFVEGMACQCAYIGADDPMYTNLGMIPGVHYITYKKDDFEDFIEKIRYYQKHPRELAKIATQGCNFVRDNFNREQVGEIFWKDIEVMLQNFSQNNKTVVYSSFDMSMPQQKK